MRAILFICGERYKRFEQPVFVKTAEGEQTVHSNCLPALRDVSVLALESTSQWVHNAHGRAIDLWADSEGDTYLADPAWPKVKAACAEAWEAAALAFEAYSDHTARLCRVAADRWRKLTTFPGAADFCRERSALLMTWDAYRDDIRKAKAKLTA